MYIYIYACSSRSIINRRRDCYIVIEKKENYGQKNIKKRMTTNRKILIEIKKTPNTDRNDRMEDDTTT